MSESEEAKTTFRLPKALLKEVKRYAIDNDTNATEVFKEAIRAYLIQRRNEKEKPAKKKGSGNPRLDAIVREMNGDSR
jgi:metal-responsive CopG/Arc/MetJ family transcriptional regulator